MIIANIAAIGITIVAVYVFVTYAERRFNAAYEVARDLRGE